MYVSDCLGNQPHAPGFAAADVYLSAYVFLSGMKFGFGLFHQFHDFFGTFAQDQSFGGEQHALSRSDKQFLAEFVFEFLHLPGERRLGQVQGFGCSD